MTTPKTRKERLSLKAIDQQIEALKEKKKRLEIKQAQALLKKMHKLFGAEYSDALILGILTTAYHEMQQNPRKKETWIKTSFPFPKRRKRRTTSSAS